MKKAFWILPCLALVMSGADVSGKWSGTIDVEDAGSSTEVQIELVQKADTLSGKIVRTGATDETPIRNGKVDGEKISFEVPYAEGSTTFKFTLTLANDHLEGEMRGSMDQGEIVGKVKLTRATT